MKKNKKAAVKKKKKSRSTLSKTNKNSTITFEISKDLTVIIHSRINSDIVTSLIDKNYIKPADVENEAAIQVAFVLLANEISDQLLNDLTGINSHAN